MDNNDPLDALKRLEQEQAERDEARLQELYQKMRQSLCDDEQVDEAEMLEDFEEKWRETPE
ncbi:hypothetical protein [Lacunimicrobium album]